MNIQYYGIIFCLSLSLQAMQKPISDDDILNDALEDVEKKYAASSLTQSLYPQSSNNNNLSTSDDVDVVDIQVELKQAQNTIESLTKECTRLEDLNKNYEDQITLLQIYKSTTSDQFIEQHQEDIIIGILSQYKAVIVSIAAGLVIIPSLLVHLYHTKFKPWYGKKDSVQQQKPTTVNLKKAMSHA